MMEKATTEKAIIVLILLLLTIVVNVGGQSSELHWKRATVNTVDDVVLFLNRLPEARAVEAKVVPRNCIDPFYDIWFRK